jgi:hypothetical protein
MEPYAEPPRFLQVPNYLKKVSSTWVPSWTKHSHQALCRLLGKVAQGFKANSGINIVAQNCLVGLQISRQETLNAHSTEGEKPPEFFRADDSYPDQRDSVGVFLCPNAVPGTKAVSIFLF